MYDVKSIIAVLEKKEYAVFKSDKRPFNLNLVGIRTSDNSENSFNDWFTIFWKYGGVWNQIIHPITTDPGTYWRKNPINTDGTAILKPGQYKKLWSLGLHQGKYEALKQTNKCVVYRDNDKDVELETDGKEYSGLFGINYHRANAKKTSSQVDKWSAGCQVCPDPQIFEIEIEIFKQSAKTWGDGLTYTLIEDKDFK